MKKFFAIMAAALVAFSFASCKGGNEPENEAYKIEITDITAKGATITVTPVDSTVTYYWDVLEATEAAKLTDEQVGAYLKEYLEEAVEYYKQYYGYDATLADFLLKGENSYSYTKLESNTEYTVVAIALDANGASSGKAARKNFKTLELKEDPVPADMTFEIAASDITFSSANITVTPSNTTATYYWNIYKTAEIASMSDEELCAAIKENIEYTIEYYAYFDQVTEGMVGTAYTVIAVAMGTLGTTNGAVAKYDFSTPEIVAEKTEDITLTNAKMNDACDAYGWWQMMAANTDSTTYITISPNEAAAVEGSYSIDDMDADYTYILLDKQDQYNFATLDIEIAVEGETFVLTGTGIAMNAVQYNFNISGDVEVLVKEASAPAKVAPVKKDAKIIKKVNLEKTAKRSEKLFNL